MDRLANPWALGLLALLLPIFWAWFRAHRRPVTIIHGAFRFFESSPTTWRVRLGRLPRLFRVAFIVLAVLALARPQEEFREEPLTTHGVDIVVVLDRSASMRALDLTPDRITVAKRTIKQFVEGRPHDRLGLVLFATESYSACPLTLDHTALLAMVDDTQTATKSDGLTAIGLGLASAINRLKESDAKSRVVVLLTDGRNNEGQIAPMTAAAIAKDLGMRIYTIGIGTRGSALFPFRDQFGRDRVQRVPVDIDEETLKEIAALTGGKYFRADEDGRLEEIFSTIDALEKSEVESQVYISWSDRFEPFLILAGLIFLIEALLLKPMLRRLP